MITISHLRKSYGRQRVLDDLDLEARPGEVTLLVGANGSGKTTTLRQLCGLSAPDAGRIEIAGVDLAVARLDALARLSFLPQSPRFHPRLTTREILDFYARLRGLAPERVDDAEARWGLADVRSRTTGCLSGGTRQKLSVVLAMLGDPDILLLDEPYQGLDLESRQRFWALLWAWGELGGSALVVTHDHDAIERAHAVVELPVLAREAVR
jgi:ABC-type multidrug transport system ATPase subunit